MISGFRTILGLLIIVCFVRLECNGQDSYTLACENQELAKDVPTVHQQLTSIKYLSGVRSTNELENAFKSQDFEEYNATLVSVYIGMIILSVLLSIFFMLQFSQIFCQMCCNFMRRDTVKEPYGLFSIYGYTITALVSGIVLLSFSASLIDNSKLVVPAIDRSLCKSYEIMDKWLYARGSSGNWMGTQKFEEIATTIITELENNAPIFQTAISKTNISGFSNFLQSRQTQLEGIIETEMVPFSTLTVDIPNPEREPIAQANPDICYLMGGDKDNDDVNKVIGSLNIELDTQILIVQEYLQKMRESAEYMRDLMNPVLQDKTIIEELTASKQKMVLFQNQFQDLRDSIINNQLKFKSFLKTTSNFSRDMGSVFISFVIVGLSGLIFVMILKTVQLRHLIYAAWLVVSVFSILSWILTIFVYTKAIVFAEICQTFESYLTNPENYVKLKYLPNTEEQLTCFYDSGELDKSLGLRPHLMAITEIYNDIQNLRAQEYLFTTHKQVDSWISEVNQYINFEKSGIAQTLVDDFRDLDLPANALDKLNSWSNIDHIQRDGSRSDQYSVNCGALSRDFIVFTESQCDGRSTVPVNDPSNGFLSNLCINLDNSLYDEAFILSRLDAMDPGICSGFARYKDQYHQYFTLLSQYTRQLLVILKDGQVSPPAKSMKEVFTDYKTISETFQAEMTGYKNFLTGQYADSLEKLFEVVSDPVTGIYNNFKCDFMRQDLIDVRSAFCRSPLVRTYDQSWRLIIVSLFSSIFGLSLYFSTSRAIFFSKLSKAQFLMVKAPANQEYNKVNMIRKANQRINSKNNSNAPQSKENSNIDGNNVNVIDNSSSFIEESNESEKSIRQSRSNFKKILNESRHPIQHYQEQENEGVAFNPDELAFIRNNLGQNIK